MSAPSSDGRPSTSSEPSVTSSRTLHSRGSGAYAEYGEGSSYRQSHASGYDTGAAHDASGASSRGYRGLLPGDSIDKQDFARRRQRVRRSGGFLLDSSFAGSHRKSHLQPQARTEHRGKHSVGHLEVSNVDGQQNDGTRIRHSSMSPTSAQERHRGGDHAARESTYIDTATLQVPGNDGLYAGRTRDSARNTPDRIARPTTPQPPAIDPNQLVHMALSLSESRRRNMNAGPLLASQARAVSGTQREGSFSNQGAGSSLRQYLNEQRRVSRNMSPAGGKGSPSRHMSTSMQRSGSMAFPSSQFKPSAATIARRDKARDYIELRMEYLRLLEYLPPLKLDANAPGNFIVSANNMLGSPHAQLTRVPSYSGKQYDLGRPYNPLQYIRNRRSRARERRALVHTSQEFADVHEVRDWVDAVEQSAQRPGYRRDDGVSLPKLHDDHPSLEPSKPPGPHKGWIFSPEELLADAYWLEQDDNKTIIENRHGRKIYPTKEWPTADLLQPRASKEYPDKRRRSWIEGIAAGDPQSGGESERGSERGRKRRLLPVLRSDSPKHGKHSRRGSRLRAHLDSDSSDSEDGLETRRPRIIVDDEHNTGPLALQLETILKQQAIETQEKSPAIISPDTPDKWGRHHIDESGDRVARDSLEVPRIADRYATMDHPGYFKMPPRVRTNATLTLEDDIEPRSSFEDLDTTAPNTPLYQKRLSRIGSNLSPPPSRDGSVTRKSRRSRLNPFHSHENSGDHEHNQQPDIDLASLDKKGRSRQTSEEKQESGHVGHAIMAAPSAVKSLLTHRKNESTSSLSSPDKMRRRDMQEPHSAVTRFFQGVKHEGSKVGGFVFRRDRPDDDDTDTMSDSHTAEYGTDTSVKTTKSHRPTLSWSGTATTIDAGTPKQESRYRLDLPTFKPAHEAQMDDNGSFLSADHISRQNLERKNSRSPRFERLAPPRMDLEKLPTVPSQVTLDVSRSHSQDRMNKVLARPGGVGQGGLFATLRDARDSDDRNRSGSRPALGERHWSITDGDVHSLRRKTNAEMITQADIARVRALFLSSGVKAKEIDRRAKAKRSPPADFLIRAAKTANRELLPVARKEEHVLAARILLRELESSTKSLSASTQQFRNKTIKELADRISDLRQKVDSDLMPRIFEGGDTAVRITSEISGRGPLQVKQITDDINRMLRARKRRMRWLRSFGWMLVEWALVAVMWWLWLVVVLVGSVKRVFGFGWGVVRWLLWL